MTLVLPPTPAPLTHVASSPKPKPISQAKRKRNELGEEDAMYIATLYADRAHDVLLRKALEVGREKVFHSNKERAQSKLKELRAKAKLLKHCPTATWNQLRDLERAIEEAQTELGQCMRKEFDWMKQTSLLQCGTLSSLVQVNRLLQHAPETYLIDDTRCPKCHIAFRFRQTVCRYQCPRCARLQRVLSVPEDVSVDTLINKAKTSGTEVEPSPVKVAAPKPAAGSAQKAKQLTEREHEYREYLLQWVNPKPVPNDILLAIFQSQVSIHLGASFQTKATKVREILQKKPEWKEWVSQSARVTRAVNCVTVPKLQMDMVERLCQRFHHLGEIATEEDNRKMFLHEVVTCVLLRLEGEQDAADGFDPRAIPDVCCEDPRLFHLHKTRAVLEECSDRYQKLITQARQQKPDLWPNREFRLL